MATDKSEPRVGVIFRVGLGAVVTLVVLRAALVSYFDRITQAEEHRKIASATPIALINVRAEEQERLHSGPEPIDKAMHDLAVQGRTGMPEIAPSNSRDVAPLQGWARMPAQVPALMMAPPPVAAEPGGAASNGDGGPTGASGVDASRPEGGAPKSKPDGGAPKKKP